MFNETGDRKYKIGMAKKENTKRNTSINRSLKKKMINNKEIISPDRERYRRKAVFLLLDVQMLKGVLKYSNV